MSDKGTDLRSKLRFGSQPQLHSRQRELFDRLDGSRTNTLLAAGTYPYQDCKLQGRNSSWWLCGKVHTIRRYVPISQVITTPLSCWHFFEFVLRHRRGTSSTGMPHYLPTSLFARNPDTSCGLRSEAPPFLHMEPDPSAAYKYGTKTPPSVPDSGCKRPHLSQVAPVSLI